MNEQMHSRAEYEDIISKLNREIMDHEKDNRHFADSLIKSGERYYKIWKQFRKAELRAFRWKTAFIALASIVIAFSLAGCQPTTVSPEIYATSYHTRDTTPAGKKYNQFNPGAGIHITQGKEFRYGVRAATFRNSFKDQSNVVAATAEYCLGDELHACGGIMAGGVTGYSKTHFAQFAAAPTIELGYGRTSIDFTAYPTSDRQAVVLTGWLKFKLLEF